MSKSPVSRKSGAKLINFLMPKEWVPQFHRAVQATDSDMSKFIRNSIREKAARVGVPIESAN